MSKRILIAQGPIQYACGLAAMLANEIASETEDYLVVADCPGSEQLLDMMASLHGIHNWQKVVYLMPDDIRYLKYKSKQDRKRIILQKFNSAQIEEIYASASFFTSYKILTEVFEGSNTICFGDSIGLLVGDEPITHKSNAASILLRTKKFLRDSILAITQKNLAEKGFNKHILFLPVNECGEGVSNLIVPAKDVLENVLRDLSDVPRLRSINQRLTAKLSNENSNIYLLANISNSNRSTVKNEVRLYRDFILETCTSDRKCYIKPHPRNTPEMISQLLYALRESVDAELLLDKEDLPVPIELLIDSTKNSRIYTINSTSRLSLLYLRGIECCQMSSIKARNYLFDSAVDVFVQEADEIESMTRHLRILNKQNMTP